MSDHENHDAADVESARGRAESNADASDRENVRHILTPIYNALLVARPLYLQSNTTTGFADDDLLGRTHLKMQMTPQ
jgi:hypothetical protein